jgi:hypothetical protein
VAITGKEKAMKKLFVVIILAFFAAPLAFGQNLIYGGVTLQPGDVINLYGGPVTSIPVTPKSLSPIPDARKYGHTAMYVGLDPATKKPSFLCFTTRKEGWEAKAFGGRILTEKEFLSANMSHKKFDVFRLQNAAGLDQKRLIREAKKIAAPRMLGPVDTKYGFPEVCSSAVAKVLRETTGNQKIRVPSPEEFSGNPNFRKQGNKSINISDALSQVKMRKPVQLNKAGGGGCPPGYYKCGKLC